MDWFIVIVAAILLLIATPIALWWWRLVGKAVPYRDESRKGPPAKPADDHAEVIILPPSNPSTRDAP